MSSFSDTTDSGTENFPTQLSDARGNNAVFIEEPIQTRRRLFTQLLNPPQPAGRGLYSARDLSLEQLKQCFEIANKAFIAMGEENNLNEDHLEQFLQKIFTNWKSVDGAQKPSASDGWIFGDHEEHYLFYQNYCYDNNENPLIESRVYITKDPPTVSLRWETPDGRKMTRKEIFSMISAEEVEYWTNECILRESLESMIGSYGSFITERTVQIARYVLHQHTYGNAFDLQAELQGECNLPSMEKAIFVGYPIFRRYKPSATSYSLLWC